MIEGKPIENKLIGYSLEDADGKKDPSLEIMIADSTDDLENEELFGNKKKKKNKRK